MFEVMHFFSLCRSSDDDFGCLSCNFVQRAEVWDK
jgi:hypothetical protein